MDEQDNASLVILGIGAVILAVAGGVYFAYKRGQGVISVPPAQCLNGCPSGYTCINGTCQQSIVPPGPNGCPNGQQLVDGSCQPVQLPPPTGLIISSIAAAVNGPFGPFWFLPIGLPYLQVTVKNPTSTVLESTVIGQLYDQGVYILGYGQNPLAYPIPVPTGKLYPGASTTITLAASESLPDQLNGVQLDVKALLANGNQKTITWTP